MSKEKKIYNYIYIYMHIYNYIIIICIYTYICKYIYIVYILINTLIRQQDSSMTHTQIANNYSGIKRERIVMPL